MNISVKKTIGCIAVITMLSGCQTVSVYEPVEVTKIVNIPNHTQSNIYNKTRQWFSQYFVSGKSVVDYEDKETGTIIGNAIASNGTDPSGLIKYDFEYNIRIDTKDNKFRAMTTIVKHTNTDYTRTYDAVAITKERQADAEKKVSDIVNQIKSYVIDNETNANTDW
ncbi:DUF4468 domain-containing protein [Photobacterium angustum]|uniref:DUF4468 domain-containing protein n=1 Tax=Photobacterium angustum TaxID=661 RepID=UPI00069C3F97|nr:DUF4468 domain-containing protein [Photobacterium angustum]PSW82252.1 DUF4468 domain-containing protein [Photobacterium angustum]